MQTPLRILLLIFLIASTCGLSWGGESADQCRETSAIMPNLAGLTGDELVRQEERILRLCPDGDSGKYVKNARRKRSETLQKRADDQMAAGLTEQAADAFRQILSIDRTNNDIRYTLAVLYERQAMLDEAEQEYRKVVLLDPKNGDARRHLADIYILQGNFQGAIGEYNELLKVYGNNPLLHFKLARAYERDKKYLAAITEYQETIKLAPENLEAHKELAALYMKMGKGEEATNQYQMVLKLNRKDVATRNALISLYVKLRKHNELFALLKEGVDLFPGDPNSHFRLGLMYDFRKKYDASIAEYLKAIELKSDHAKALKGIGKLYFQKGRYKVAREYLEAAKKADPDLLGASELLNDLIKAERKVQNIKKKKSVHRSKKKSVHRKAVKKVKNGKKKLVKNGKSSKKKAAKNNGKSSKKKAASRKRAAAK